jgi:hypothetical protein
MRLKNTLLGNTVEGRDFASVTVPLLFRIREVMLSNIGPKTDYSETLRGFPQLLQENGRLVLSRVGGTRDE